MPPASDSLPRESLSVSIVGSRLKGTASEAEYRRVFTTLEQEQPQALIINKQSENTVCGATSSSNWPKKLDFLPCIRTGNSHKSED